MNNISLLHYVLFLCPVVHSALYFKKGGFELDSSQFFKKKGKKKKKKKD